MLADAFRIKEETLSQFERRIARARAVLALRGIATDAAAAQKAVQAARLADRYQKDWRTSCTARCNGRSIGQER